MFFYILNKKIEIVKRFKLYFLILCDIIIVKESLVGECRLHAVRFFGNLAADGTQIFLCQWIVSCIIVYTIMICLCVENIIDIFYLVFNKIKISKFIFFVYSIYSP